MTCKRYSGIYTTLLTTGGDLKQETSDTNVLQKTIYCINMLQLHIQRHGTKVGLKDKTRVAKISDLNKLNPSDI